MASSLCRKRLLRPRSPSRLGECGTYSVINHSRTRSHVLYRELHVGGTIKRCGIEANRSAVASYAGRVVFCPRGVGDIFSHAQWLTVYQVGPHHALCSAVQCTHVRLSGQRHPPPAVHRLIVSHCSPVMLAYGSYFHRAGRALTVAGLRQFVPRVSYRILFLL